MRSLVTHQRYQLLALAVLGLCFGCITQRQEGEAITYYNELGESLLCIFGGGAVAVLGFYLQAKSERIAWVMMMAGAGFSLVAGPGMFLDYVTVSPEHFELRTGLWFYPTLQNVRFADVESIQVTSEEHRGRRGSKSTHYYIVCGLKSGGEEKVAINDMMKAGAAEKILTTAEKLEIPIEVQDHW